MKLKNVIFAGALSMSLSLPVFAAPVLADEASHQAAAEELLLMTKPDGVRDQVWQQVEMMMDQQYQQLGSPEELAPTFKKYSDKMSGAVEEELNFDNIRAELVAIYVKTYSEEELTGIADFYKSDVGQAYLEKMPQLMRESREVSQKQMHSLGQRLQALSLEMNQELEQLAQDEEKDEKQEPQATGDNSEAPEKQ